MRAVVLALALVTATPTPMLPPTKPVEETATTNKHNKYCYYGKTTGYVRTEFSGFTFDGTSIYTSEAIAAAGWDIPLQSKVEVEDIGTFRIADRGMLGPGHIDIAVWTRSEAYAITGIRKICVWMEMD